MNPKRFFQWRGYLMAPYGLLIILLGKPSHFSFLIGLAIACVGEAIRIWGVGYAGKTTRKTTLDAPLLVTAGPYAYVRHPIYVGNALMGFGGFVMAVGHYSALGAVLFLAAYLLFYGIVYGQLVPLEDHFLEDQFGDAYARYKKEVPRILPRLSPYAHPQGQFHSETILSAEINTLIPFLVIVLVMAIKIQ